jgi:hypothetical protein
MERLKESDIKGGVIQTVRGKTLVPSRHPLWPETLAALKRADWFNVARAGRTLSEEFKLARREAAPKAPPMKFLRHTSGNEVKKIAGGEISEVHLAHTEGLKMQGPYTERLWDQHAKALRELRKVFAPVWAA